MVVLCVMQDSTVIRGDLHESTGICNSLVMTYNLLIED